MAWANKPRFSTTGRESGWRKNPGISQFRPIFGSGPCSTEGHTTTSDREVRRGPGVIRPGWVSTVSSDNDPMVSAAYAFEWLT